jgi:hypothetical protein
MIGSQLHQKELVLAHLRTRGIVSVPELGLALNLSQPTLSRVLTQLGDKVQRLGRARATRYALVREHPPHGSSWPIYRVDANGQVEEGGMLTSLYGPHWRVEAGSGLTPLLRDDYQDGISPGLPWFLHDLRPQGFLGRAFARAHASTLGAGNDPRLWSDDITLAALLRFGHDGSGNLILGKGAYKQEIRGRALTVDPCTEPHKPARYASLAQAALAGAPPGSSAAGEQPKFTDTVFSPDGYRHVIVKFSPVQDTPSGRRWADLLIAEHIAGLTLATHPIASAETSLVESAGRMFLESHRFDRVGEHGRRGLLSLFSLDAAYYGKLDTPWTDCADRLERDEWISKVDADRLRLLWWFGLLIANTDMHYGNASLLWESSRPFSLAPSYDMLPMLYAPSANGELVARDFQPPIPTPRHRTLWFNAAAMAIKFWHQVASDRRITSDFQSIAAANAHTIEGFATKYDFA